MKLSPEAEEVATFFAKMLEHEYTTKDIFRKNFFKDWRKVHQLFQAQTPNVIVLFLLSRVVEKMSVIWSMAYFSLSCFLQEMTSEEKSKLTDLKKCDFAEMSEYFKAQSEARKAMSKEQKLVSSLQLPMLRRLHYESERLK